MAPNCPINVRYTKRVFFPDLKSNRRCSDSVCLCLSWSPHFKSTDQSLCRMFLILGLCNSSVWLRFTLCILSEIHINGTLSSVYDIRGCFVKLMFARLLHCKVTIILFILNRYLFILNRYLYLRQYKYLVFHNTNFNIYDSYLKQVILSWLPFWGFSNYLKFKFMSLRGKGFKNHKLNIFISPKTNNSN